MQNIDLKKNYSYNENSPWFKHIQGNGIDNLKVNSVENSKIKNPGFSVKEKRFNKADEIYMRLPDPVSNEYGIKENIDHPLYKGEWVTNDTTLIYSKGGTEGTVQIISKAKSNLNFWAWLFSIIIAITVFTLIVWNLLKYIANVLLNLDVEKLKKLKVSWDSSVFNNNKINRILIHSFNGDFFLKNAKKYLQVENSKNLTVKTINALDITKPDFDCNDLLAEDTLIWINGFDQSIYEIDKHKILLIKVQEICRNAKGKVIVDLPFDLESIDEFYDDYMAENEIEQKDITDIYLLKKRWKTTFKNFHEFNGYLNQKTISNLKINTTDTHNIWSDELDVEPENNDAQFLNIWDNLTGYEKIVLYDLADDGLLNRKYKTMIQRLVDKKLIILSPYPKLFSEEFRNYVNLHMEPKDVKTIERKLGLKGKWRNIQYLILLILVPLAALILISQGMSIEKIFGIFAGIITVITGAMRVFDSNTFKSAN